MNKKYKKYNIKDILTIFLKRNLFLSKVDRLKEMFKSLEIIKKLIKNI